MVANALSRRHDEPLECLGITTAMPVWIQEIMDSYEGDDLAKETIQASLLQPESDLTFTYINGLLKHKGKLYTRIGKHLNKADIKHL